MRKTKANINGRSGLAGPLKLVAVFQIRHGWAYRLKLLLRLRFQALFGRAYYTDRHNSVDDVLQQDSKKPYGVMQHVDILDVRFHCMQTGKRFRLIEAVGKD